MKSPLPILLLLFAALLSPLMAEPAKTKKFDPALPNVLIIGDSISMGYTPLVTKAMAGKANVVHNRGNSQGTTNGLVHLDDWLKGHEWQVIHFNFGLHDFKRVKVAGGTKNSNDTNDPRQANLKAYTANLEKIVARLKKTKAKLIFATTTPFPAGVKPHRDPEDSIRYNTAALEIMKKSHLEVNDLYALILPKLETLQQPVNVHFHHTGSQVMADAVVEHIQAALAKESSAR